MKQRLALKLITWGFALLEPSLRAECQRLFNQAVKNKGVGGYHDHSQNLSG